MSAGFEADAVRLAASAGDFDGLAVRAAAIAERLERALDGAGRAWGDGAVGQAIAASHVSRAEETLAGLRSLSGRLTTFGRTVGEAAGRYRGSEEDAEQAIIDTAQG
ncbi:hypothetical protein GCM10017786_66160 [Amycolatopsis deserti]|uniref:ESAT-6-like protein n=1 Tax=Amycolatopsis deserti TaxID=185696 RepID=A0ABQ3JGG2_9PSEU|nr:hypothetical protein [Amycolatopsis deserti]GHF22861.1 hypothetical protein GCM10017786_66160 [Amycolatopsis deserti]